MKERPKSLKYAIRILILIIACAVIIVVAASVRPDDSQVQSQFQVQYDLTLWYYDENLTPYLNSFGDDYFKTAGKRVDVQLVPSLEFFDNINQRNVEGEGAPDLYVIDSTKLENAYLSSLAKPNIDPFFFENEFLEKSLSAASYKDVLVGYPLCFNTSFLAYRSDIEAPQLLSDVKGGFSFDVSNLLYSYFFIGGKVDLGGPAGDDAGTFDLSSREYAEALSFMQSFAEENPVNSKLVDYKSVERDFIQGKLDTAIFSLPSLTKLYGSGADFSISRIPDLTEKLPSKTLSQTSVICVNPDSRHVAEAEALAKYLSYDHADHLHEQCGLLSARMPVTESKDLALIADIYEDSESLPKLIETENIWENLSTMLVSVWNGEEIEKAQSKLNVAVYVAISTRTEQEDK